MKGVTRGGTYIVAVDGTEARAIVLDRGPGGWWVMLEGERQARLVKAATIVKAAR